LRNIEDEKEEKDCLFVLSFGGFMWKITHEKSLI